MRYLIYYAIILGVCVIEVSYTVKYVKRILEGCSKLQKISEKRIDAIKLHDFHECCEEEYE